MGDMRHVCCRKCLEQNKWTVLATLSQNSPVDDEFADRLSEKGCLEHRAKTNKEDAYDTARLADWDDKF